jgi:hypothetical protein
MAVYLKEGGTSAECLETGAIVNGKEVVAIDLIVRELIKKAQRTPTGPIRINLSSYGGSVEGGANYPSETPEIQKAMKEGWFQFARAVLNAIASLDGATRERLVLTLIAGNDAMPICDAVGRLRTDPRTGPVLTDHVLIVSTTLFAANSCATDDDVVNMDNSDAVLGTSLAGPATMVVIEKVIATTEASPKVALRAIKQAAKANAQRKVVLSEAVARAAELSPICGRTFSYCFDRWLERNATCSGNDWEWLACYNESERLYQVCMAACKP